MKASLKAKTKPKADPLVEAIARFDSDPLGFVYFAFPWQQPETELASEIGPDDWQAEVLSTLGKELRAGTNADEAAREAAWFHGVVFRNSTPS